MADFDSGMLKDMAKLKNINEADELLRGMKESGKEEHKNEYSTFKEVEELRLMVEKQKYLLHAFWLMLKEHGATNEDLDKALNEAVLLSKRTDYKNVVRLKALAYNFLGILVFLLECLIIGNIS